MNGVTAGATDAARKRVAVEMVAKHERALRRTARRYSICAEDAEDAFQRALEILLLKAPPGEARDLIRWMQTVTKHEALAIRRSRERQVSSPRPLAEGEEGTVDWVALIPASTDGPAERAERREEIARSREALKTLKAAELRALTLLAQGYSYAEIGELTGYSQTKVNRCLAEGRERFRAFLSHSESGGRCAELRPHLSAFCDGEAESREASEVREHLRACARCRAALRAYRAAPGAVAALAPVPLLSHALAERVHHAASSLHARLAGPRAAAESAMAQVAAGGGPRGGYAGLAKLLALCAASAGSTAACVAAGVVPPPLDLAQGGPSRPAARVSAPTAGAGNEAPTPTAEAPAATPPAQPEPPAEPAPTPETVEAEVPPVEAGAVEYTPAAATAAEPAGVPSTSAADPAGEFGP